MSSGEGLMDDMLLVWMSSLCLKACSFTRTTFVREGMSVYEERKIENTLQSDVTSSIKTSTRFAFGNQYTETRQVYSSFST